MVSLLDCDLKKINAVAIREVGWEGVVSGTFERVSGICKFQPAPMWADGLVEIKPRVVRVRQDSIVAVALDIENQG